MKHTSKTVRPFLLAALGTLSMGVLAGCSAGDENVPSSDAPFQSPPPPPGSVVVAEFVAHVNPGARELTFKRIERVGPRLSPQDITDPSNIPPITQDDLPDSGSPNTVELVTNSVGANGECPAGFQSSTFCGNVTLRHFYNQSLSNAFVQVTNITPSDNHNGVNSDPSEFGLTNAYGLWKYTSPAATTPGVLGNAPYNEGTRDWIFANPDDASTDIRLRVLVGRTYANYAFDFSNQSFINACDSGTHLGKVSNSTQTMPFPFTLYDQTMSTVRFTRRSIITFGSTGSSISGDNLNLPNTGAPGPAIFAFWDDINYGSIDSEMCFQSIGATPNRQYVITWKNMNFANVVDNILDRPASLTYSAILSEGTNNIDLVYDTMTGPTDRASGNSATVGVQNASKNGATFEFNIPDFGSNNAYSLLPIP